MVTINLVCVGGIKEKYYLEAQNEFEKRLSKFCKLNIIEVKPSVQTGISIEKQIEIESCNLKNAVKGFVCCFDRRGDELSSEELAKTLNDLQTRGISEISFVIGGSFGMSEDFLSGVDKKISFGKITLPHTLARVVALEQIYRAFTILNNISYHK